MITNIPECISFSLLKTCILIFLFFTVPENLYAQTWTHYQTSTTSKFLTNNYVNSITIDEQGNKWFGTEKGISVLSGAYNPTSVKPDFVPSRYRNLITPNPNNGEFFLKLDPDSRSNMELTLINQSGQVIEKKQIHASSGISEEYINWTHLSKGIYILIISTDEFVFTEKVVIN